MSDNARLVSSSRSAPRDPNVRSGRQPVSIFNDTRAYRLWDGQEDEEDSSMSRAHSGTLASKETDYRINVMHRTFRASQRGPRASARAQVGFRLTIIDVVIFLHLPSQMCTRSLTLPKHAIPMPALLRSPKPNTAVSCILFDPHPSTPLYDSKLDGDGEAQVDEIVSETEGGDDDRKFYESLEKDLDPEQLARLRERNKKRLDALERQLTKLSRLALPRLPSPHPISLTKYISNQWDFPTAEERKEVVMQGGTDPEDEGSDAGMTDRTRAYQPDPYKDDTSASDSSPVKRECTPHRLFLVAKMKLPNLNFTVDSLPPFRDAAFPMENISSLVA